LKSCLRGEPRRLGLTPVFQQQRYEVYTIILHGAHAMHAWLHAALPHAVPAIALCRVSYLQYGEHAPVHVGPRMHTATPPPAAHPSRPAASGAPLAVVVVDGGEQVPLVLQEVDGRHDLRPAVLARQRSNYLRRSAARRQSGAAAGSGGL